MTRTEKIEGTDAEIQNGIFIMEEDGWEVRGMVPASFFKSHGEQKSAFWVTFWRDADR